MNRLPLNEEIAVAMSQLVYDAPIAVKTRKPSHTDISDLIVKFHLQLGDPKSIGKNKNVGKAKRIIGVLRWALEFDPDAGERFASNFLSIIRGYGGFREESENFVTMEVIRNLQGAFKQEGIIIAEDGSITPVVLDNFSDVEKEKFLESYIRRAKRGADDAALLTGTSKDLLEAVSKHVIERLVGKYEQTNFPTLLGTAFTYLGLSVPIKRGVIREGDNPETKQLDVCLYELGCAVNSLRNKQGTGHGRPFLANLSEEEAKTAVESMGVISEYLLSKMKEKL